MRRWMYRCGLMLLTMGVLAGPAGGAAGPTAEAAQTVPVVVDHIGGQVHAVYAAPGYLLWGQGAELMVYSPDGASPLGRLLLGHVIRDIEVVDSTAYVAASNGGLYVVDLSDPSAPTLQNFFPLPAFDPDALVLAESVAVKDGYAYVAVYEPGLWVVELAAPDVPPHVEGAWLTELRLVGDTLLAFDDESGYNSGYEVWDVSNAAEPQLLGGVDTGERVSDVDVRGAYVYVAAEFQGVQIRDWNPTNPLSATLAGAVDLPWPTLAVAAAPSGAEAFALSGGGLARIDTQVPAHAQVVESLPWATSYNDELAATADRVFVAGGEQALAVFAYAPDDFSEAARHGLPGDTRAGTLLGGQLYLAQGVHGVARLPLAGSSGISAALGLPAITYAADVLAVPPYLAVADGAAVRLVDPDGLTVLGSAAIPGDHSISQLAAADGTLLAAHTGGVCALTLDDPQHPQVAGCADLPGPAVDVAAAGTTAYAAVGGSGVAVLDVSDPAHPLHLGTITGVDPYAVAVHDNALYISDLNGGGRLRVLAAGGGFSQPPLAEADTRGFVRDMAFAGDLMYLANEEGVQVLLRLPNGSLVEWANYTSAGDAVGVVLAEDVLYLMDGANGVVVLLIPPPEEDVPVYRLFLPVAARG